MIKNVQVIPGCISCRNCEMVCPKIFKVDPTSKVISHEYEGNESEILQAEAMCPVQVIKVEKIWNLTLNFKKAKVLKKEMLTSNVLEITFETWQPLIYKPGQYISLQGVDWMGKFSRSYSLASLTDTTFTITVKLLKKWRGSEFLKKLKIGNHISFLWPLWNFYLKDTSKKKVFIATGTWLAPMIAMLDDLPKEGEKVVFFWVRSETDIYYKEKLEQYENTKVIFCVSQPKKNYTWNIGRVTEYLDIIDPKDEVYICGNPEMVLSVREKLQERWHPESAIFYENFTISRVYPGFWKDIFLNGNIPGIEIFSYIIIAISLTLIPLAWWYNYIHQNLYGSFLGIGNFMWFLLDVSWWSVVFVMLIRPLSDLFPKLWFLRKLTNLRKAFWILSASIIVVNTIGPMFLEHFRFLNYFTSSKWSFSAPMSIVYGLSEVTAMLLLLTSSKWAQRKLWVWWKRIQKSSYLYFVTGGIAAAVYTPMKIYPILIFWGIIWVLAQMRVKLWK